MIVRIFGENETAARARALVRTGGGQVVEHGPLFAFAVEENDNAVDVIVDGVDSDLERRFVAMLAELTPRGRIVLQRGGGNQDDRALAITVPSTVEHRQAVSLALYRAVRHLTQPRDHVWNRIARRVFAIAAITLLLAMPVRAQITGGTVDQGQAGTSSWPVTCTSGCGGGGGGGGQIDNSAFTISTTTFSPIGGVYKDAAAALADGVAAAARLTSFRAVHVNLRDNSGAEIIVSTAGNQTTAITKLTSVVGWLQLAHKATGVVYDSLGTNDGFGAMGVRNDTPIATGSVDGTFAYYSVGSTGRMWTSAKIDTALPAGTNVIGALSANQSVNVNQIAGAGLSATNFFPSRLTNGIAYVDPTVDNAAFGSVGIFSAGVLVNETLPSTITEGHIGAPRMSPKRILYSNLRTSTGTEIDSATTAPSGTEQGLIVRPIPSGTQTISGTATVTQGTAAAATAPWPVSSGVPAQVSGSLVNTGDTVAASAAGMGSVAVKFSIGGNCSGSGCNFVYEASLNNSDFNPVEAWTWQGSATLGTTLLSPFITETTTAGTQTPGLSLISLPAGVTNFRVRRLDANTGTVAIIVAPSASPFSYPQTTLPSSTSQSMNLAQIAGSTIPQANGTTAFNTPRFTLSSDSTGHVELWDGTNTAAVKAASTIAAAADPSLVVAISPNSPLATGANTIGAVTQASGPWTSNVTQFGGSAVATGTGASGVGIPRVTISNDSSLAANQSVNVAQINAVTPLMGNGTSGTGAARVAIASDNTAVSGLGAGATGSAPPANAIFQGARESTNLVGVIQCDKTAQATISSATTTSLVAVSGSTTIFVCSYVVEIQGVATTAGTMQLESGTGAACVTTHAAITPTYIGSTTAGTPTVVAQTAGNGYLFKTPASNALCAVSTTTTAQQVFITYAQF